MAFITLNHWMIESSEKLPFTRFGSATDIFPVVINFTSSPNRPAQILFLFCLFLFRAESRSRFQTRPLLLGRGMRWWGWIFEWSSREDEQAPKPEIHSATSSRKHPLQRTIRRKKLSITRFGSARDIFSSVVTNYIVSPQ